MNHFFVLIPSITLFCLGLLGLYLKRSSLISLLISLELILLSVNINFVGFAHILKDLEGQIFTIFVLCITAAEAAIGLAIILVYYRNKKSILFEDLNQLKG